MNTRRDFLKTAAMAAGAGMIPQVSRLASAAADTAGKPPMRFIFMHKGNGLFPQVMVPPSLGPAELAKEQKKEAFEVSLDKHDLPAWMNALNAHKKELTILQGLSGKMCTNGHHSWQSCLGVYAATERLSSIKWATVDFELARMYPSPLEHIELACFPNGGGNPRGNINGIEAGFSARGPQQPNYAFGSPKVAIEELFKTVANSDASRVKYELERKVLDFAASRQGSLNQNLDAAERAKVRNYAVAMEDIRSRNGKLESMRDVIARHYPKLDKKYLADDLTTIDRQLGHVEVLLSTLISGMTNVVTFTVDELGTPYTGVPKMETETINLHDVGHNKPVGSIPALEVRQAVRTCHMTLIDKIVTRLKSVPEGNGTMFDNTMLFYFPDNGETHHSIGIEWPYIVLSGRNAKLNIAGRYIRLPYWGTEGHKTIGNWFTTVLNAYGNPIKHYGDLDLGLNKLVADQTGPIRQFLS
jgi:hypothetical protein